MNINEGRRCKESDLSNTSTFTENTASVAVPDYDATQVMDPSQVSLHACDILVYHTIVEEEFRLFDYTLRLDQTKYKKIRAKVVDWFVQMQEDLELDHKSLYRAVKLFDMFMAKNIPDADDWLDGEYPYQAAGALLLAIKLDTQKFSSVSKVQMPPFLSSEILAAEREVFRALNGRLNVPLSYNFLQYFAEVIGMDFPPLSLACYYLETSLHFAELIPAPESMMAAAALMLAMKVLNCETWGTTLVSCTGYESHVVEPFMRVLNHAMHLMPMVHETCRTVFDKYSDATFFCVAKERLLPDKLCGRPVELPKNIRFLPSV